MIRFHSIKDRLISEIEGRLLEMFIPILEVRMKAYYSTEEFKDLVRALVDEILHEEIGE